jgi:hypothetical protein
LREVVGDDKANIILEYNTYQRVYNLFGTGQEELKVFERLYKELILKL